MSGLNLSEMTLFMIYDTQRPRPSLVYRPPPRQDPYILSQALTPTSDKYVKNTNCRTSVKNSPYNIKVRAPLANLSKEYYIDLLL